MQMDIFVEFVLVV